MHISIIGYPNSGKSVVAEMLLRLLAAIRGKGAPQVLACAERQQGAAYLAAGSPARIMRSTSVGDTEAAIKAAAGGVAAIETMTALHAYATYTWLEQHQALREKRGHRAPDTLPTMGFVEINRRLHNLMTIADEHDVDLIEIHREAPLIVHMDDGLTEERDGVKPRGMGEAGLGANLALQCSGGLRSKKGASGYRSLWVIGDLSGNANCATVELRPIRKKQDRRSTYLELKEKLEASLIDCRRLHREDVEAWKAAKSTGDTWELARRSAESPAVSQEIEKVRSALEVAGLLGDAATTKAHRARVLAKAFGEGIGSLTALKDLPLEALEVGGRKLQQMMPEEHPPMPRKAPEHTHEMVSIELPAQIGGEEQAASQAVATDEPPAKGKPTGRKATTEKRSKKS